jgi:hypothetical integral membrane protein (TIGR02206 family)
MLFRPAMLRDIDMMPGAWTNSRMIWSQWDGYLQTEAAQVFQAKLMERGVPLEVIHTSGRASITDLKRLAAARPNMTPPFVRFGPPHLMVIALTFAAPLFLAAAVRWSDSAAVARAVSWFLVGMLVGGETLTLVFLARDGDLTIASAAPMYLCDWAAAAAVITLIHPNQRTYELCYFWALAGTMQALLTPDLSYGFPDPRFISFFALHGGVIAAALYLTLGVGMRPVPMSIVRALAWSAVYLAVAMAVNAIFGTNYGYLRAKPAHASLLDDMAPWPFYIPQLVLLAILSCLVYYLPFFMIDRLRRR